MPERCFMRRAATSLAIGADCNGVRGERFFGIALSLRIDNAPGPLYAHESSCGDPWTIKEGETMDFVERFLGASPDAGNGTYEVLLVIAVLSAAAIWTRHLMSERKR